MITITLTTKRHGLLKHYKHDDQRKRPNYIVELPVQETTYDTCTYYVSASYQLYTIDTKQCQTLLLCSVGQYYLAGLRPLGAQGILYLGGPLCPIDISTKILRNPPAIWHIKIFFVHWKLNRKVLHVHVPCPLNCHHSKYNSNSIH